VDGDAGASGEVALDDGQRSVDPGKRAGVMALVGLEKGTRAHGCAQPPAGEHLGQHGPDPEFALQG
jgi:hypothetical protein